ncbi:MAG: ComEA family DNA-binding protein [Actinomycetota bacterium]|nr:ComEA family DNA-binding protein [Actinomycetota bacterium]
MSWRERRDAGPLAESAVVRLVRLVGPRETAGPSRHDAPGRTDGLDAGEPDPWRDLSGDGGRPPGRVGGWSGRSVRALAAIVVACAVVAAWWWWSGRPRTVVEPTATAVAAIAVADSVDVTTTVAAMPLPADPSVHVDVVVHVAGLVSLPGLVRLPAGSRVADAIAAAGGVTKPRAADSVNLARVLVDGEQVVVTLDGPAAGAAVPAAATPVVDLNRADQAALESLPGVGPVLAARVLAWRAANGSFRSVDELGEVAGIGQATLARLRPLVRV